MRDNKAMIHSLEEKVLKLIADNRMLRRSVEELTQERDRLVLHQREFQSDFRAMSRKLEVFETAQGMMTGQSEQRIARLRVNKLLREIDKCLALMNK